MKKEEESVEEVALEDEELLNFEFDDLSEDEGVEATGDSSSEEDILELVDVVEEGETPELLDAEKTVELPAEKESVEVERGLESEKSEEPDMVADEVQTAFADADMSFESELELDEPEGLEGISDSELDKMLEEGATQSLELDIDSSLEEETLETSELEETEGKTSETDLGALGEEKTVGDVTMELDGLLESEEIPEDLPSEEELGELGLGTQEEALSEEPLEEEAAVPVEEFEEVQKEEVAPMAAGVAESISIPEEKIEAVVNRAVQEAVQQAVQNCIGPSGENIEAVVTTAVREAVQDVVEKVTRETMATVAESVISKAIENLRESLEIPAE